MGLWLLDTVLVSLLGLVVVGMVLRLGHCALLAFDGPKTSVPIMNEA